MPASSASLAEPTPTSTSTPAGTSSARSSSRSTCPSCCGRSWRGRAGSGELVALGTNTDPYQWVESRYRMMPEILAALEEAETPVSVLTKSPLVMRDIELFERMAKRLPVSVNLSVPTLDEKAWRATEPHTPSPERPPRRGRRAAPPRDRLRRPDRAADARHQRHPRAGRSRSSTGPARRARPSSAASPSTCATRSATSSSAGSTPNAPTCSRATRSSTQTTAPTCAPERARVTRARHAAGAEARR